MQPGLYLRADLKRTVCIGICETVPVRFPGSLYSLTKFSDDTSFKDERTANGYRALGQGETGRRRATAARRVLPSGGREEPIWATVQDNRLLATLPREMID